MIITLTGLSYKTAPVEVRERVSLPEPRLPEALCRLKEITAEAMIISTCNRLEILARHRDSQGCSTKMLQFLAEQCGISPDALEKHIYHYEGIDAIRHILRVAGSLDSMVLGETQILGQIKKSFAIAQQEGTLQSCLHILMDRAFAAAKKIRTETTIAALPVSVSSVAVDLASNVFGDLSEKTVFVLGAGKMSVLSIQHLRAHGVKKVLVANRTFQKAVDLAGQVGAEAVPLSDMVESLAGADIVISSTGSSDFIVTREQMEAAMARRKNRPVLLIDIAVPRDIDPKVHEIGNVFLYDIDDLQNVVEINRQSRRQEALKAEAIVEREAVETWNKLQMQKVAPAIREIQQRMEHLCKQELERSYREFGKATDQQKEGIENLAHSLAQKLLQGPFSEIRKLVNQPDGERKIQFIQALFAGLPIDR